MSSTKMVEEFEGQLEGEEVLLMFRKHPIVMRKGLVISAIGLLVGPLLTTFLTTDFGMRVFNMEYPPSMNFFLGSLLASLVLSAILFFPSWMSWYFSIYLLTNQRFVQIKQQGFFNKSVVDIGLDSITMINYEVKGVQETLLGFGTIVMQTYVGELVIREVHHPAKLQRDITTKLRESGFLKQTGVPQAISGHTNE